MNDLATSTRRVPGEAGIWVLIFGDLLIFSLFFVVFVHARGEAVDMFAAGHETLSRGLGLLNTFLLLTSSLFVARGVHRASHGLAGARLMLRLAMLCGAGFVGVKAIEYSLKIGHGLTPMTNDFYMYYFAFTGIHLLHVVLGLAGLGWMQAAVGARTSMPDTLMLVESGGIFWHLIDLLWIVLFALFYVLGGR